MCQYLKIPINELMVEFSIYKCDIYKVEDIMLSWVAYRLTKDYSISVISVYDWSIFNGSIRLKESVLKEILYRSFPLWAVKELEGEQWVLGMVIGAMTMTKRLI